MSLFVKQFRFYGDFSNPEDIPEGDKVNYPESLTYADLTEGTIFSEFTPILSLGVQSLPGTKLFINNSESPIILGHSGLYELKVDKTISINSLQFNLQSLKNIHKNPNGYLIIDILYEEGE